MKALPVRPSAPRFALAAAVAALSLSAPAGVQAAGCQGAPGTSALEQYCEAIPDAAGGRQNPGRSTGSSNGSGSSSNSGAGVSSSTAAKLSGAGADGAAVEQLAGGVKKSTAKSSSSKSSKMSDDSADGSGVAAAGGSGGPGGGAAAAGAVSAPADPSNSPLKAATKAVGGGPTVGGGLVWGLLAMTAIGAIGAVVLRRHNAVPAPTE